MEILQPLVIIFAFISLLMLSTIIANQKKIMKSNERVEQKVNKLLDELKTKL